MVFDTQRRHKTHGPKKTGETSKMSSGRSLWEIEQKVFEKICNSLATPYALNALQLLRNRCWSGLSDLPFPNPDDESFPDDYLVYSLLSKNPRLPLRSDRRGSAIKSFWEGEKRCESTNDFIRSMMHGNLTPCTRIGGFYANGWKIIDGARKLILSVLGSANEAAKELPNLVRFGPGATFSCSGYELTPLKKLHAKISMTPRLLPFWDSFTPHAVMKTASGAVLAKGGRATTVPKNAKTDRFIGIEPSINMLGQLAIGKLIRRRIKRILGIDLSTQADVNRSLARKAQKEGLATIDLKNASNSIAFSLIELLLPREWFHLLDMFRSSSLEIDGIWHDVEMFSSMGNGFTFELETLVFLALARQFDPKAVAFGDDVIVTQETALDVIDAFQMCGFETNEKKTFLAGCFFESCGVDVWHGRDIRPFFLRTEDETDLTSALLRMANAIRRYAHRRGHGSYCDRRFRPVWNFVVRQLPPRARDTYVPEQLGDTGLLKNLDECSPQILPFGHEGFFADCYLNSSLMVEGKDDMLTVYACLMQGYTLSLSSPNHGVVELARVAEIAGGRSRLHPLRRDVAIGPNLPPVKVKGPQFSIRGRVGKGRYHTAPVENWSNLGPWL